MCNVYSLNVKSIEDGSIIRHSCPYHYMLYFKLPFMAFHVIRMVTSKLNMGWYGKLLNNKHTSYHDNHTYIIIYCYLSPQTLHNSDINPPTPTNGGITGHTNPGPPCHARHARWMPIMPTGAARPAWWRGGGKPTSGGGHPFLVSL